MNYKAIALGAAIGFVFALTPSCSPSNEKCSAANCAGCCNGDECIPTEKQNNASCGASGNACQACGSNQVCNAGACQNVGTGNDGGTTDGGAACGPSNCNGCCSPVGCLPGTSFTNCGTGGAACVTCTAGQTCTKQGSAGGVCTNPPVADGGTGYGSPCMEDSDCSSIGPGAICKKSTTLNTGVYEGGYCTKHCTSDQDCGSNQQGTSGPAFCVALAADLYGEEDMICWDRCDNQTDRCRTPGYACYKLGMDGPSGCWISPLPNYDGGWMVGNACTSDSDCQPPSGGACVTADAGFPGGYCSGDCIDNPSMCGSDNFCICANDECSSAFCGAGCRTPGGHSTCRPGYTCYPVNGEQTGYCFLDCTVTGCNADAGEVCASNGFCQVVDAGSPVDGGHLGDGGTVDAGIAEDGGTEDGGMAEDGGTEDAGIDVDAG